MKKVYTRREFIGAAAASAFTFTYLPSRVWGANNRVNVASIGVGGKGASDVMGAANQGCNIVALCDVDAHRGGGTFQRFPKAKRYQDFRVMLEKQKDIDAVTVSTPDHVHGIAAITAMQLGKHCYCQKPLAHCIYEARVMAKVAAEHHLVTQMGNQAHAGEPIRRAVEVVRAGIIGKVHEAHVWTNRPIWPQGVTRPKGSDPVPDSLDWNLWLGPAPWRPYKAAWHDAQGRRRQAVYAPFTWRGWWDFGTGALGDMACHLMDMAYWGLDLGYPDSVEAVHEGATSESPPLWSTITYQFPGRGKRPPVKFVWYDGKINGKQNYPPPEVVEGEKISRYGTVLVGEKGKFYFNRGRTDWLIKAKGVMADLTEIPKTIPRTKDEDYEWVNGIRGGKTPLSNFSRSGPFTEVVLLGNLAIRTGKKLDWDGKNLRATNAPEAGQYIKREYRKGWSLDASLSV